MNADPVVHDPQPNAGRIAAPRFDTPAEVELKVDAAVREAANVSAPIPKVTMPLRATDEQRVASLRAQLAEAEQTRRMNAAILENEP